MGRNTAILALPVLTVLGLAPPALAGTGGAIVGLDDLAARLGGTPPTGAGVVVSQVEVSSGGYGPDQANAEFAGKAFTPMSGPPGSSGHATTVGQNMYGNTASIAPGVTDIFLYEANSWATSGFLRTNTGLNPMATPGGVKLFNNSWIGSLGSNGSDNNCLHRADFVVTRDDVLMTSGVNNSGTNLPLMASMYNGISVGIRAGTHSATNVAVGIDGAGRMKPEIVAPGSLTSWATPVVNAAGALLVETARTWPGLDTNPNAERSDVIKAALLAGATHEDLHDGQWSNDPATAGPGRGVTSTPIDDVVGAGTAQVDRAHLILTGGEQDGAVAPPAGPNAERTGWDVAPVSFGGSRYWRVNVAQPADEVSILVTWHREIGSGMLPWWTADLDLLLWRMDDQCVPATLVGDDGLPFFTGGNVVSESGVDNVEHLHVTGLAPGDYVIEVRRVDGLSNFPTWDAAIAWIFPASTVAPADITGDGAVNVFDLLELLAVFGSCAGGPADINRDGVVNVFDLLDLLSAFGT